MLPFLAAFRSLRYDRKRKADDSAGESIPDTASATAWNGSSDSESSLGRRFIADVLRYLPAAILPALVAALAGAIFTRMFSPQEYGLYSLVLAIVVPVTSILTVWAEQPAGRFYSSYEAEGRGVLYRRLLATLVLALAIGILLLGVLGAGIDYVIFGRIDRPVLYSGAVAMIAAQSAASVVLAVLPASLQSGAYRRAVVTLSVVGLAVALGFIAVFGKDVAWIFWGQAVARASIIPYVLGKSGVRLRAPLRSLSPEAIQILRRFWRYGAPMMLWFVASTILNSEDRYVIQAFRGSAEVGLYSANYNVVFGLATLLNAPVIIAAGPLLYRQWAAGAFDAARRTMSHMTEIYVILALAMLGGVVTSGKLLADLLLGPRFHAGSFILVPVMAGLTLWGAGIIGHKGLEIAERTLRMAASALLVAVINLVLNLLFVPRYGYGAAAYSTLGSYAMYVVIIWFQTRTLVPWEVPLRRVGTYALIALTAAALGWYAGSVILASLPYVGWILGFLIFIATYGGLVWLVSHRELRSIFASAVPASDNGFAMPRREEAE